MPRLLDWWRRFIQPSPGKPTIGSISPQVGFLIFILCLASMELGTYLAEPRGKSGGSSLNLVVVAMLLVNWLASQFRWSAATTIGLRVLSVGVTVLGSGCIFWRCFHSR